MKKRILPLLLALGLLAGIVPQAFAVSAKADVVFVIDSTGSMEDEIRNVKNNITEFARYLESLGVSLRIGVVEYRDIEEASDSTVVHTVNYSPWHNSADEMVNTLSNITAAAGGDTPESLVDAMGYMLDDATMRFSSDAFRFGVILTDADVKNRNVHGLKDMNEVTDKLVEKRIYTSVISSTSYRDYYKDVYTRTDGIFADITSDFSKVLKDLADRILGVITTEEGPTVGRDVISVQSVRMNLDRAAMVIGKSGKVTAEISPYNASDVGLNWYVDDEDIAVVDKVEDNTCTVKGVSTGTTRVVAVTNDGGYTTSTKIYVVATEEELPIFFEDVEVESWAYPAIRFVNRAGLFSGSTATSFDPEGKMARGTMVTVLYRLAGEPEVDQEMSFEDVRPRYYYTAPIAWAASADIVQGYNETTFGPEDNITREQVVTILHRYVNTVDEKLAKVQDKDALKDFKDAGELSEWAVDSMTWAVSWGLMNGHPNGKLDPAGEISRAEVAAMIQRLSDKLPEK